MGTSLNSKLDWDCLQSFVTEADENMTQLKLLLKYVAVDNEAANVLRKWVSDILCVGQEPAQNGQAGCKALEE